MQQENHPCHARNKVKSIYLVDVMPESVPVALGILKASIEVSCPTNVYYYYDQITPLELNAIINQLPQSVRFILVQPPTTLEIIKEALFYLLSPASFTIAISPAKAIKYFSFLMNWKTYQVSHAMLDASASSSTAASAQMSLKHRIIGLLSVATGIKLYKEIRTAKPDILIMGHMVYRSRACLAYIRQTKNLTIIQHVGHYLYRLPSDKDLYFGEKHIHRCLSGYFSGDSKQLLNASNYWENRTNTGGDNSDLKAVISTYSKEHAEFDCQPLAPNYIFLHVFRDSPFHFIDKNRLFVDYVDWIRTTLNIIRMSSSQWALKIHPSASLWGEDQYLIINKLLAGSKSSGNIIIDNRSLPSIAYLDKLNKVITYNGTVALEAIALDLKPIVIQSGPWSDYLSDYCYAPHSLNQYKKLLLDHSSSDFRISESLDLSHKDIAKLILYARERYYRLSQIKNPELRKARTTSLGVNYIIHNFNAIKNITPKRLTENFI